MKVIHGWTGVFLHKVKQGFTFEEACLLTKVGKSRVIQECQNDSKFDEKMREAIAEGMSKKVQWNG